MAEMTPKADECDTPLWILKPVTEDGLCIALAVCELPVNDTLSLVNHMGSFHACVTKQVVGVIESLRGNIPSDFIVRADGLAGAAPLKDMAYDVLVVHFQKAYRNSTENAIILDDDTSDKAVKDAVVLAKMERVNALFKDGVFTHRFPLRMRREANMVNFLLSSPNGAEVSKTDASAIRKIRSKIAT